MIKGDAKANGILRPSPELVWDTVVRITDRIGSDEAKSIRILLYLALVDPERNGIRDWIKTRVQFCRRIVVPRKKALPDVPKGRPLFAFLYGTPANTNNLLPVFDGARKRGWHPGMLLDNNRVRLAGTDLDRYDPSVTLEDLMATATLTEWLGAMRNARKHFADVFAEFRNQIPEWTLDIRDKSSEIIQELAFAMVATSGLRRLLSVWEPSFVISTSNLWPFDCAIFDEARRVGIPSFVIQHGVTNHYWWPFNASKMFLWGKRFEGELLNFGANGDQLSVCGMPAADQLFSHPHPSEESTRAAAISVVVLSHTHARSANQALYAKFNELFTKLVRATPSVQWSIKLHPNEDDGFYRSILEDGLSNLRVLSKEISLADAVSQADIACTLYSTSGLEAMMMHRPLVVFDLEPIIHNYAWWPQFGGGTYLSTAEAMVGFVDRCARDSSFYRDLLAQQDRFLAHNFENRGRAAEAILDTIELGLNAGSWKATRNGPTARQG